MGGDMPGSRFGVMMAIVACSRHENGAAIVVQITDYSIETRLTWFAAPC